jgi:hypothetical protein
VPNGIHLNVGTNTSNTNNVCADIQGNDIGGSGNNVNLGEEDFRLRQRQSSTIRLRGYTGAATDTAAVVAYVQSTNTGAETGTATATGTGGGGFFNTGGAGPSYNACLQPTVPT